MSGSNSRPATLKKREGESLNRQRVYKVLDLLRKRGQLATSSSVKSLERWFVHLSTGSSVDLRTPFFTKSKRGSGGRLVNLERKEIVSQFMRLSKSVKVGPYCSKELLDAYEEEHVKNIGVMSSFLPWAVDGPAKARAVFTDKPMSADLSAKAWRNALLKLQSLIPERSCPAISVDEAIRGTKNDAEGGLDTTTNSGLPWVVSPWKPHDEIPLGKLDLVKSAYNWYVREVKENIVPYLSSQRSDHELPYWWALSGQRLVQKGSDTWGPKRKRLVEAYPKHEAIASKIVTTSIMEAARSIKAPSHNVITCAWFDIPTIDVHMQHILKEAAKNKRVVLSGDISAFDATVPPWALWDVASTISKWSANEPLMRNLLRMMIYRTILATPTGLYGPGPSSMKSGSGFTNLLGTMTNIAMQFYGEELGLYKIHSLAAMGDDFVIDGQGVSPDATAEVFSHFKMEAHPDKQWYRENTLQYLKRLHINGSPGGIASAYRTLGSVLSLEKMQMRSKDWNKFAYVVQALSRLQNATFNPLFETLVRFVQSGDRLALCKDMSVKDMLTGAGKAGSVILKDESKRSWRNQGSGVTFENWSVNGVVRGESLPPEPSARFRRVYGQNQPMTL